MPASLREMRRRCSISSSPALYNLGRLALLRFLILAAFIFPTTVSGAHFDEIRIDVPARAQLKVRNDFGKVSVEVWDRNYVTVSTAIDGSATLTRSPILIDNRGALVTINVVRRPTDPSV